MTRFAEIGGCRVWMRGDEGAFVLHPRHHPALLAAWKAGLCFYDGSDVYDDVITVNLRNVVAVSLATPAAIGQQDDDQREQDLVSA